MLIKCPAYLCANSASGCCCSILHTRLEKHQLDVHSIPSEFLYNKPKFCSWLLFFNEAEFLVTTVASVWWGAAHCELLLEVQHLFGFRAYLMWPCIHQKSGVIHDQVYFLQYIQCFCGNKHGWCSMGKAATQGEVLIPGGYTCTKICSESLPVNVWLVGFNWSNFILVNWWLRKHVLGKSLNALRCN